jgi:membrane fusion protein, multidrug efflux system
LGHRENAVVIPEEALIPQGEKYFVYVAKGGKAHFTPVEVGQRRPGQVEIITGIKPNDRVIVGGIQKVQDGAAIKELSNTSVPGKGAGKQKAKKNVAF